MHAADDLRMQDNTNLAETQNKQTEPQIDPADLWWRVAAGEGQPRRVAPPPPVVEEPWRWRYSWLFGIMYGPIPVGFIIGVPLLLVLFAK